jgi:hypothetical protein
MTQILEAYDAGNDVLLIHGTMDGVYTADEGEGPKLARLEARGWVSALANHFDADAYQEDGHRKPDAKPRAMTPDEQLDYCKRLIEAQNSDETAEPARKPLGIKG